MYLPRVSKLPRRPWCWPVTSWVLFSSHLFVCFKPLSAPSLPSSTPPSCLLSDDNPSHRCRQVVRKTSKSTSLPSSSLLPRPLGTLTAPLLAHFSSSLCVPKPLPSSTSTRARMTTWFALAVARLPDLSRHRSALSDAAVEEL